MEPAPERRREQERELVTVIEMQENEERGEERTREAREDGRGDELELTSMRNDEICLLHTLFHPIFELEGLNLQPSRLIITCPRRRKFRVPMLDDETGESFGGEGVEGGRGEDRVNETVKGG